MTLRYAECLYAECRYAECCGAKSVYTIGPDCWALSPGQCYRNKHVIIYSCILTLIFQRLKITQHCSLNTAMLGLSPNVVKHNGITLDCQ